MFYSCTQSKNSILDLDFFYIGSKYVYYWLSIGEQRQQPIILILTSMWRYQLPLQLPGLSDQNIKIFVCRCRASQDCPSFLLDYDRSACFRLNINTDDNRDIVVPTDSRCNTELLETSCCNSILDQRILRRYVWDLQLVKRPGYLREPLDMFWR